MDPSEIKHVVNEAMRAGTDGIGDPCAEAEETLKTHQAKQEYDEAVLNGDDEAARGALEKAGNLLSTGFQKIRYKTGEYIGNKLDATNTRLAAPITPETASFKDFLADRRKDLSAVGLQNDGRIADKKLLLASSDIDNFFGNEGFRIKSYRSERSTTAAQEVRDALRSDKFASIFDDQNEFGKVISQNRLDQIQETPVKNLAKKYNRAVRTSMIQKAARKLVYSASPKEAVEKYIEDSANEVRSTLGTLHTTWNDALTKLPEGTDGISPELNLSIAQELMGEESGNAQASRFAMVIKNKLYPLKRELMGDAGINYETRNNYLPTMHDAEKIAASSRDLYVGKTLDLLDLGAMDIGDRDARSYLERVYQGFEERAGRTNIDTIESSDSGSVQQRRKLIFKDAKSYIEYHKAFGRKSSVREILSDFVDEAAHQITGARRYGDPDGFHVFKDLVNAEMKAKQDLAYSGRLAVGKGDDVLVDKIKGNKSALASFLQSEKDIPSSEVLDNFANAGAIDKNFLDVIRNATSEKDIIDAVKPFSSQFKDFLNFAERKIAGDLPMHERTLGDKAYNWISAGARGSLYAWMGVKGLIWDVGQRVLASSQTKDIASSIADVIDVGNTSETHLNAIGMITKEQMNDLELKSRAFSDNALRNKFESLAMRLNFSELYAQSTQSAVRTGLLYGLTENLDKTFAELPQELKDGVSAKAWETFRNIDEKGDDFLLDHNKKMIFKNPAKILNGSGFTPDERAAAEQIQTFINDRAARNSQLADETTRISRAQVQANYADNTLERALHSSIFGVSNIMKAFSRKTAPMMINLLNQGRYGSIAGLVLFSTMLGALNKTVSLFIEGKRPSARYFEDPSFWLDSMDMGGLVTNFAVATALQVHDSQDFKSAVASTMYGSGLQASYDLYQLSGAMLTGDKKAFGKYAKSVLDNDFSIKRIPVAGLVAQRLIMDPIVNTLDPEAAMTRQRSIAGAAKRNTPYYWQQG